MKIAFLTPEYPHERTGDSAGIGSSIKNLASGLLDLGNEVCVLVYGQKEDAAFSDNGLQLLLVRNVKFKGLSWLLTRKKIQRKINRLCLEGKIDLAEAPDWTGITAFMNLKCPLVIREHGSDTYFCHLDGRKVKWWNAFLEKKALQKAAALIATSHFTGELTNRLFGLQKDFKVIPNAIDAAYFRPAPSPSGATYKILYFGSLIRKKGLLELPHIFNRVVAAVPNAELLLIGKDVPDLLTGTHSTWRLMQDAFTPEALQQVSYLGAVPYEQVKEHLAQAQVCVFPSFAEAFPVSWLEAMAMGKAIVASDIGWAKEMIHDEVSGFLAHPQDHALFASKIVTLLSDASLAGDIGASARRRIETEFDTAVVSQRNLAFYKSVIQKP